MASVTLEAVHLGKRFGARTAVEDVSFTARESDVLGLLGRNGAGKTTTIRLLTTVLAPTSGEFWVAGQPGTASTEIRRRVGVLPESNGYPGHQTGLEYLRYHARLYGMGSTMARSAAADLLVEVGLDERANSPISGYSRGMRQRLGIARALVNSPAVVFLDEPTLGLDPAGQFQVLRIIRDIAQRRGVTVILSTHTLPEVEEVCTRAVILDRGRVLVSGTVSEVIATAMVERSAQLRVPLDMVERARQALTDFPDLTIKQVEGRPDMLSMALQAPPTNDRHLGTIASVHAAMHAAFNAALVEVVEAQVPVLSFEVEGARLSDAFLKATSGGVS